MRKNNRLERSILQLKKEFNLTACFGVEIEFFVSENIDTSILSNLVGIEIKPEKGRGQFEIELPPSSGLVEYAAHINFWKERLTIAARKLQGRVDFSAKPKMNDYGSSMHFHLNFIEDREGSLIDFAARALCHFMLPTLIVFLPHKEDYLRLDHRFMAPVNVSYGNNNRTTAVRIPGSLPCRLEHRVPSALADPYLVMLTILQSVLHGLRAPGALGAFRKIYGNAFDEQYNLLPLPKSIEEAKKLFKEELLLL